MQSYFQLYNFCDIIHIRRCHPVCADILSDGRQGTCGSMDKTCFVLQGMRLCSSRNLTQYEVSDQMILSERLTELER